MYSQTRWLAACQETLLKDFISSHPGNLPTKTNSSFCSSSSSWILVICILEFWLIYVYINLWSLGTLETGVTDMSCHVGAGNWTQILWRNSQCSWVIFPAPGIFFKTFLICALKTNRTVTFKWILKGIFFSWKKGLLHKEMDSVKVIKIFLIYAKVSSVWKFFFAAL